MNVRSIFRLRFGIRWLFLLILLVACALTYWRFHADRLVGEYYQGDGLGHNLHLTLKEDGTFDCQSTGCVGNYGSTSGTWSRSGKRITMNAIESSGEFEDSPLGNMTIVTHGGRKRLIRDADAEMLKAPEMLPFLSFDRMEAGQRQAAQ
jgi:hypothetical protein